MGRACLPVGSGRSAGGGKPRGGISTVDGTSGSPTRSDQSRLRPGAACCSCECWRSCSWECWRSRCRAAIALSLACSAAYLASSADSSASSAASTASSSAIAASSAARRASWSCSSKSSSSPASSAPPRPPVLHASSRTPYCKCVACNCGLGRGGAHTAHATQVCSSFCDTVVQSDFRFCRPPKGDTRFACKWTVRSVLHLRSTHTHTQPPLCASLARFRCVATSSYARASPLSSPRHSIGSPLARSSALNRRD